MFSKAPRSTSLERAQDSPRPMTPRRKRGQSAKALNKSKSRPKERASTAPSAPTKASPDTLYMKMIQKVAMEKLSTQLERSLSPEDPPTDQMMTDILGLADDMKISGSGKSGGRRKGKKGGGGMEQPIFPVDVRDQSTSRAYRTFSPLYRNSTSSERAGRLRKQRQEPLEEGGKDDLMVLVGGEDLQSHRLPTHGMDSMSLSPIVKSPPDDDETGSSPLTQQQSQPDQVNNSNNSNNTDHQQKVRQQSDAETGGTPIFTSQKIIALPHVGQKFLLHFGCSPRSFSDATSGRFSLPQDNSMLVPAVDISCLLVTSTGELVESVFHGNSVDKSGAIRYDDRESLVVRELSLNLNALPREVCYLFLVANSYSGESLANVSDLNIWFHDTLSSRMLFQTKSVVGSAVGETARCCLVATVFRATASPKDLIVPDSEGETTESQQAHVDMDARLWRVRCESQFSGSFEESFDAAKACTFHLPSVAKTLNARVLSGFPSNFSSGGS